MAQPTERLGVVLVEPLPVVRKGLSLVIERDPELVVIAEVGTADAAIEFLRASRLRVGTVVLVSMGIAGEHDSFWLIRSLREEFPFLHVLACGGNTEGMTVSQALFTGADGFVDKGAFPEDFVAAIKQAANGGTVLEGLPVDCLGELAEVLETWTPPEPPSLTEREIEVIAVAAEGLTARQIGTRLGLRERTVTTHLGKIYKKLGAQSRVSAIATAHRSGIIVRSRNG